jgi:hypothetical protein
VLVLIGLLWAAPSAIATSSVVANTDDSGAGSLRAAVSAANLDPAADTITFAPGVTGQINLTSGGLTITHDLTITGPGATALVVDGNNAATILQISGSTTVAISGLGFASGLSSSSGMAGAIQNGGTLSVSQSDFGVNDAVGAGGGAIQNTGSLTVRDSTFAANAAGGVGTGSGSGIGSGGAIDNTTGASLIVSGSTFGSNTAGGDGAGAIDSGDGSGGAIATAGPATITNSTLTANTAGGTAGGGGFSGQGTGGAIDVTGSTTALINDTIDANSVGSAPTSSGAGIDATGMVTAQSTIVSGNTGAANCHTTSAITSDHSLEGPAGQTSCGFDLASADPLLQPLADNGGPTETQALGTGSPAIDAVPRADCPTTTDQRGLPRPDSGGSGCDIGAYEVQQPTAAPLPAPSPVPAPPPAPILSPAPGSNPSPVIKRLTVGIATARATVTGRRAPVHLVCRGGAAGATCRGRLSLTLTIGKGKRAKAMTLGSTAYSLKPGAKGKTIGVRLTAGALTRLQRAAGRHLKVVLVVTLKGRPTIRRPLVLRLPAKRSGS